MTVINLIIGLFMIALGFLVKSFPNLIAGYNTMSKEKKKNVDVEGLSTFMRNVFILIGLTIIFGYYILTFFGFNAVANIIVPFVIVSGVTVIAIYAQRFDHNKNKAKRTKLTYLILGIVLLFVIGSSALGYIPSKTTFTENTVEFSGMYGFDLEISNIEDIELADEIPLIMTRTNGFSLGSVKKGTFNLDGFGKSQLLLHSDKPPYLIITKRDGDKIIVNYESLAKTKELYGEIIVLTKIDHDQ